MNKILFAEDHFIVIKGMQVLFETEFSNYTLDVVATTGDLMHHLSTTDYKAAIIDLHLADADAMYLIAEIRRLYPELSIVIFTATSEKQQAHKLYHQGIKGYINKQASDTEIVNALHQVFAGKVYLSESFARYLLKSDDRVAEDPFAALTSREMEVLRLLIKGAKSKDVSERLQLKPGTIATYKAKIFSKLGVSNLIELSELVNSFRLPGDHK